MALNAPKTIGGSQRRERHAENLAVIPEKLARGRGAVANVRAATVGQDLLGWLEERWVPQSEQDARCKTRLPLGVRRDDLVHEGEQALGVILHLDVDVKVCVLVLGLRRGLVRAA